MLGWAVLAKWSQYRSRAVSTLLIGRGLVLCHLPSYETSWSHKRGNSNATREGSASSWNVDGMKGESRRLNDRPYCVSFGMHYTLCRGRWPDDGLLFLGLASHSTESALAQLLAGDRSESGARTPEKRRRTIHRKPTLEIRHASAPGMLVEPAPPRRWRLCGLTNLDGGKPLA